MNKERRKQIDAIKTRLSYIMEEAQQIAADIAEIRDEEQDYFDNMPESFQNGEKGQRAEEVIGYLEEAENECEGVDFESILSLLDQASE